MKQETARRMVRDALKRGELVRPDTCGRCGVKPPPASDGRSQIHGHHHDYTKPLDVEWICAKCHRDETPLPLVMGAPVFGERNEQHVGDMVIPLCAVLSIEVLHANLNTSAAQGEGT